MAGVKFDLLIGTDDVTAAVRAARDGLSGEDRTLMLADIGEYLLNATRERASEEIAPDGTPWPALSPRYARRKARKRPNLPMLRFDNYLLGDRLSLQVVGESLFVGTSAIYGAAHQLGYDERNLKARPFLGMSDERQVLAIAGEHLRGLFNPRI